MTSSSCSDACRKLRSRLWIRRAEHLSRDTRSQRVRSRFEHHLTIDERVADTPEQLVSEKRRVLALALERAGFDHPWRLRRENADVCWTTDAQMSSIDTKHIGRIQ